jgi:hypothetical protein
MVVGTVKDLADQCDGKVMWLIIATKDGNKTKKTDVPADG